MAKVMLSISEELLARIDARVEAEQTTRSGWLARLADRELQRPSPEEMDAIMQRMRDAFAHIGPIDSTAAIREDRDSRKW